MPLACQLLSRFTAVTCATAGRNVRVTPCSSQTTTPGGSERTNAATIWSNPAHGIFNPPGSDDTETKA